MQKFWTIIVAGLLAMVVGCRSTDSAAIFSHSQWEDAKDAQACLNAYKHILVVCIYEDHLEDRGPHRLLLHHFRFFRDFRGKNYWVEMMCLAGQHLENHEK